MRRRQAQDILQYSGKVPFDTTDDIHIATTIVTASPNEVMNVIMQTILRIKIIIFAFL